jgi:hypothetical protein
LILINATTKIQLLRSHIRSNVVAIPHVRDCRLMHCVYFESNVVATFSFFAFLPDNSDSLMFFDCFYLAFPSLIPTFLIWSKWCGRISPFVSVTTSRHNTPSFFTIFSAISASLSVSNCCPFPPHFSPR